MLLNRKYYRKPKGNILFNIKVYYISTYYNKYIVIMIMLNKIDKILNWTNFCGTFNMPLQIKMLSLNLNMI